MITRREALTGAAGLAAIGAIGGARPVAAADGLPPASAWSIGLGARMRLLRGAALGARPGTAAGIEIALDSGFRTYWRMPGEAGVPPVFDWSRSKNLAAIAVDWPAPRRLDEAGVAVIGYSGDNVVLPLRVTASDPSAPVDLALSLAYAACSIICVPEKGEASIVLAGVAPDGIYAGLIEAATREVPKRVEAATLGLDLPNSVRLSFGKKTDPGLLLRPALGEGEAMLDVFVEGPQDWLFGAPRILGTGAGSEARLALRDHPKWVDPAASMPFIITMLTDMRAVETVITTPPVA